MISQDTILRVLIDPAAKRDGRQITRRLLPTLPTSGSQALVLTGVRRCGKSTLQRQLQQRLGHGVRLDCEDTRLFGLSPLDFPTLLHVLDERWPGQPVFLDEVQEVPEWQRFVRSLLDRGRFVCVTGSNASLLGRELGSKLTGRHCSFEVTPFCYREYLDYTERAPGADSLLAYLDAGGFPIALATADMRVLRELLRDIVQRDIAARHALRTTRHVMNVTLFLLANTGQPFSLHGLTRSLAVPTVPQTTRAIEQLQDAYLLSAVPKWSPSFQKRVVAPTKYYAVDNGLRRANSPSLQPDLGHRLENLVFSTLRAAGEAVHYDGERDLWECDFVTPSLAVQVCARLEPHNREREVRGLVHAVSRRRSARALLLTIEQEDRLVVDGVEVQVLPAWRWLLDPQAA